MPTLVVTLEDTQTENTLVIKLDLDREDAEILERAHPGTEYEGHVLALLNEVLLVDAEVLP